MRNVILRDARTQTSKVPTEVALLYIYLYCDQTFCLKLPSLIMGSPSRFREVLQLLCAVGGLTAFDLVLFLIRW